MKKKLIILALHLASNSADAYFSNLNNGRVGHYETNPIARQFCNHGTTLFAVAFAGETAAEIGVPMILRKKHPKIANALDVAGVGGHAFGAAYSATHYKEMKR